VAEFYFSRAIFSGDARLVSQMDGITDQEMLAPASTMCDLATLNAPPEDAKPFESGMISTTQSSVGNPEGTHVRPNVTNQRNTIILREIPSNTPVEVVRSLIARSAELVLPHTVRSDVADHWFVQFDKEADCLAAFAFLQSQTYLGKPIHARIKSEPQTPRAQQQAPQPHAQPLGAAGPRGATSRHHRGPNPEPSLADVSASTSFIGRPGMASKFGVQAYQAYQQQQQQLAQQEQAPLPCDCPSPALPAPPPPYSFPVRPFPRPAPVPVV
jgi:hypothetical protein